MSNDASNGISSSSSAVKKATPIGPRGMAVRSPRFSPDGKRLVFLANPSSGPHHQCASLMSLEYDCASGFSDDVKTVIPIVNFPASVEDFQGIYVTSLPRRCWDSRGRLWLNTIHDCYERSLIVDFAPTSVTPTPLVHAPESPISGVYGDFVVSVVSATRSPPHLRISSISDPSTFYVIDAKVPDGNVLPAVAAIETRLYSSLKPTVGPALDYSALLDLPPPTAHADEKCPLIVFPHGNI